MALLLRLIGALSQRSDQGLLMWEVNRPCDVCDMLWQSTR